MAATHRLILNWSGGGLTLSSQTDYSDNAETNIVDETIADSVTDQLANIAIDVSEIASIYMISDQALTVETNDGAAPDDTIVLVANVPYIWHTGSYFTNLLATDITKLYLTNTSGATATLNLRCVQDPSP